MSLVSKEDVRKAIAELYKSNNIFQIKYNAAEFSEEKIDHLIDEVNNGELILSSLVLADALLGRGLLKIKFNNTDLLKCQLLCDLLTKELKPSVRKNCTYIVTDFEKLLENIKNWRKKDNYVLIGDIHHFFSSILHSEILKALDYYNVSEKIKSHCRSFLNQYEFAKRKRMAQVALDISLPVGIQFSYALANSVLMQMDDYFLDELKMPHYARYIDDFYLSHKDSEKIQECFAFWKDKLNAFHLRPNETKSQIFTKCQTVTFLRQSL